MENTQQETQLNEQSIIENSKLGEQKAKQVSTEINNPYEKLDEKHRTAVDMAIAYLPYQQIAKYCEVEYSTVRSWFMTGGICHDAFQQQSKIIREERKEKFKQIREVLEFAAIDAALTLARAAQVPNREGVNASSDILDRVGFKPKEKVELEGQVAEKVEVNFNWPDGNKNTQDQHHPNS